MARKASTEGSSRVYSTFAEIALSQSQAQRYYNYGSRLFKSTNLEIFDDRLLETIKPYIRSEFDWKADLKGLNELICEEDGLKFSRSYYNAEKVLENLERFGLPNHKSFRYNRNYQWALEEVRNELSQAKLHVLHYESDQHVHDVLPKDNTHSGFTYLLTGKKRKGDNMVGICQELELLEESAVQKGNFGVPIMLGHRTQGSAHDEFSGCLKQEGKHKTRTVCMVDLLVICSELRFAKPLQKFLSRNVPWYAGGKTPDELRNLVHYNPGAVNYWVSLDFSAFDQTISDWLIEDAFDVIKSAFPNIADHDAALLDVICDSFIHKDFLLPGGKVKHCDKGVPSGSMFTQIIDSIVNRIVILTYLRAHSDVFLRRGHLNYSYIMGDDHLFRSTDKVDVDDLSGYLLKNFGLVLNANKCVTSQDRGLYPWFLSREFRPDGEWRHPNVLFDRMLFPERFRPYGKTGVKPADIVYCFIQTYPLGMDELIDVGRFLKDYNLSERMKFLDKVDGSWVPGSYMYIRDYVLPLAS